MTDEPYILYIEDDRPVINLVSEALKQAGYKVAGALTGQKGLAIMREHKPAVLLLDLMMPGVSGWDVYEEMKSDEQLADIPVIVITARVPESGLTIVKGLPPVDEYITKPFNITQLIRSVQRFLPSKLSSTSIDELTTNN